MNVLILCTGNSCRSILAEATFNHLAPPGWKAMSAGSQPAGFVHPHSLALLAREGISTEGLHSKSWDNLPMTPDIVITVCASAAGETCPAYLGPVLRTHWSVDDPAKATGTDAEIDAAFIQTYRILRARIEAFFALPLDKLQNDRDALKVALDKIGQIQPSPKDKKMNPIDPKKIREDAESLYASGFCCSEGSLLAIARGLRIESPYVPAVASGFCGGMARTGGACGALTGAIIGLGLALGRTSTEQSAQPASHATQRLVREFKEVFGSSDCHVLVGFDPNGERADINNAFNKDGRRARCALITGTATELAAQIIEESKQYPHGTVEMKL